MQTFEAIISLVFFIWAAALLLTSHDASGYDDSVYRLQLAGDAWRVLYLRGDFAGLTDLESIEPGLDEISRQTGFCVFVDGITATSCRGGGQEHEIAVSLQRTMVINGIPRQVTLSLGS
jgi:hypothetical protein